MMLRWVLVLIITLMSASVQSVVIPLKKNGLPEGDYEARGCYQCENNDLRLSCQCPYTDGNIYKRTLDLSLCDPLVVTSINGGLRCLTDIEKIKKVLSEYSGAVTDSGSGSGEELFEDEVTDDQLPPPIMEDFNNELPKGDYRSYCKDCKIEEGNLECSCKIDGWFWTYWYDVSLPLKSCQVQNEVTYAGGILYCSYETAIRDNTVENCTGCRIQGNTLYCRTCEQTRCGWSNEDLRRRYHVLKNIKLSGIRDCTQKINNCNGKLRCGECWAYDFFDETIFYRPRTAGTEPSKYCHPDKPTPWQ